MCFKPFFRRLALTGITILIACRAWSVEAPEYIIKATFLYNFAKFTDWKNGKPDSRNPVTVCVVGQDPFNGGLAKLLAGKSVENRPLQYQNLSPSDDLRTCQIVFASRAENEKIPDILRKLQASNVLTVGESANFIREGGHIQFFVKENKVGFEINLPAVERTGLRIDARVLNIAKIRK